MLLPLQPPLASPTTPFTHKTILITGSNTGLGYSAAQKFLQLDASRVILGVRDPAKGQQAKNDLEAQTGRQGRVEVWQVDMLKYDSIREFAARAETLDRLDVAILNAGVYMTEWKQSNYGFEETVQVNAVSTALLGILIAGVLKRKWTARGCRADERPVLEFVASRRAEKVVFSEEEMGTESLLRLVSEKERFVASRQYQVSKLVVMCIVQKLASSLEKGNGKEPDVLVTAVCPGFCQSELSRGHNGILAVTLKTILNLLVMRTSEEGARSLVSGTTLGVEGHGKLWFDDQIGSLGTILAGESGHQLRERMWTEIVTALEKHVPDVSQRIEQLST